MFGRKISNVIKLYTYKKNRKLLKLSYISCINNIKTNNW